MNGVDKDEYMVKIDHFGLHRKCGRDKCGGDYMFTGQQAPGLMPNTVKYMHRCNQCNDMAKFDKPYPGMIQWPQNRPLPPELEQLLKQAPGQVPSLLVVN